MTTFGLTSTGFVPKTLEILISDMNAELQAAFGASINVTNGILAKIVAIVCERYAELWEGLETCYSSQDPSKATGSALEALCALTGTVKKKASSSSVTLTLTGTPTTVVALGSRGATASTGQKFATTASATIAAVTAWAPSTVYAVGDRRTNSGNVYICTVAGASAGSGGPTGTGTGIVDNLATWNYLGTGTGAVDVVANCTITGAVTALARDITVIDTPVSGWSSVINILDATQGSDIESDQLLRQRRQYELGLAGSTPADSLRAALLELANVVSVTVFTNDGDVTDVNGMPPHSVEALVQPVSPVPAGFDQTVFNAVFANIAAGIATTGNTPGTATDSQGTVHTVTYSRPTEVPIYVAITLTKDPAKYPTNGDALVQAAIKAWGGLQACGKDAVSSALIAQVFTVPGVLDVTVCNIGLTASPTSNATIPISLRQLATYDTGRITVTSSNGTP